MNCASEAGRYDTSAIYFVSSRLTKTSFSCHQLGSLYAADYLDKRQSTYTFQARTTKYLAHDNADTNSAQTQFIASAIIITAFAPRNA